MLSRSFLDDPFFCGSGNVNENLRQMDQMFNHEEIEFMGRRDRAALPDGRHQHHRGNRQVANQEMFMDPFGQFGSMFSNMHSMVSDMRRAFDNPQPNGNSHVYQQSSFMSYSNTGDGSPKVYQASTSTRQGPDGVRETRRTMRDSEAGIDKVAVGHHIKDRGHVIERCRNNRTGNTDENQEYLNLDEEEASEFDKEYREKWQRNMRGIDQRRHADRARHAPVAGNRRHAALLEPDSVRKRRAKHRRE